MRAILGHSDDIEGSEAIRQVLEQCDQQLDGERPKAGLLFMSVEYDPAEILAAIGARWPGLPLIGGTTDGEVSARRGYVPDSVLLVLLAGSDFEAAMGLGRNLSQDPERAVREATACLAGRLPAVCLTTFAPSSNSSEIVQRLARALGTGCPILGGLTGDHREYQRMSEFAGSEALQDSLSVLYLFGDLRVSWGVASGWFPIGEFHRVTSSQGHLVHTIDDRPALDVFRHYWGDVRTDSLGMYPLAVYPAGAESPYTLRSAQACDERTGSIRFAGDVPEGALVRLMEVLPSGLLAGTSASAERALADYPGDDPSVALVFSCAARRWILGPQAERELELLSQALASQASAVASLAGFYCFGEIAPHPAVEGEVVRNAFHNETLVTVLIGR